LFQKYALKRRGVVVPVRIHFLKFEGGGGVAKIWGCQI